MRFKNKIKLNKQTNKNFVEEIIYIPMFIAVLFTIAKTWKQPKGLMMDEWMKNLWGMCIYVYMCDRILLSHKKNKTLPFAETWFDLEGIMISKIRQRGKGTLFDLTGGI